jgi:antitoxin ParD1/3/4
MASETMSISLPDALKQYVERRAAEGGYDNSGEYILALIRRDQEAQHDGTQEELEAQLLEGLESGVAAPVGAGEWEAIRQEGRARLAGRNGGSPAG